MRPSMAALTRQKAQAEQAWTPRGLPVMRKASAIISSGSQSTMTRLRSILTSPTAGLMK